MYPIPTYGNYNLTQWIIILTVLLWVSYDIFAYVVFGNRYTLSNEISLFSKSHRDFTFFCGMLAAHWFWSN